MYMLFEPGAAYRLRKDLKVTLACARKVNIELHVDLIKRTPTVCNDHLIERSSLIELPDREYTYIYHMGARRIHAMV